MSSRFNHTFVAFEPFVSKQPITIHILVMHGPSLHCSQYAHSMITSVNESKKFSI